MVKIDCNNPYVRLDITNCNGDFPKAYLERKGFPPHPVRVEQSPDYPEKFAFGPIEHYPHGVCRLNVIVGCARRSILVYIKPNSKVTTPITHEPTFENMGETVTECCTPPNEETNGDNQDSITV